MKSIFLLLITLLLLGCTTSTPKPADKQDLYTLMVLDSESRGDFVQASSYYQKLYETTKDTKYQNQEIESLLKAREFDKVIEITTKRLEAKEVRETRRYQAIAFTGKREFDTALASAHKLVEKNENAEDFVLIGDLYYLKNNYPKSVKYYKKAYAVEPDEPTVDKLATLLIDQLNDEKEALAYYESHIVQFGCSEYLCQRVANIYASKSNIRGVISSYKRIYAQREDKIVGQKLVELFLLQKDYVQLARWLEETRYNDQVLLEVYRHQKEYQKASVVALRLYEEKGAIEHLALHAMLLYEAGNRDDKQLVLQTVKLLERVVAQSEYHVHLNYLGYLLIDHGVDVNRGVELVKKALIKDPENPYYSDSLAWGYYMQGVYADAYKLIKFAKEKIGDDETLNEHYKIIKKAYERIKK